MVKKDIFEKLLRIQKITPNQLAKALGISPVTVYRGIRGDQTFIGYEVISRIEDYLRKQTEAQSVHDASLLIGDQYNLVYRYAAMDASGTWKIFNTDRPPQRLMDQEIYTCQRYLGYFDERFTEVVDLGGIQERIPRQKQGWVKSRYHRDLSTGGWVYSPDSILNITDLSVSEVRLRWTTPFDLKELKRKRELDLIKIQHSEDDAAVRVDARTTEHDEQDERDRKLKFTNLKYRRDE